MQIVQLFNQGFVRVARQLPRLKRLGFTHVLISPPQKSHASRSWWGRYQPVDFTRIEGPLGDLEQLRWLCQRAAGLGLAIVADAVLHHLSNEARYVRIQGQRIVAARYPQFCGRDLVGLHRLGRGRGLPILDTRSNWVRSQLRNYLHGLFRMGVRGFRFDSAKHMDPGLFPELLQGLPPLLCFGELVYAAADDFPPAYFRSMRAYDFPLAHRLKSAFAPGGDLGRLTTLGGLPAGQSVSFVNHHDLIKNPSGFAHFRVSDAVDRRLAHAYLLACPHGIPLVYGGDLRWPEVRGALEFASATRGQPLEWQAATRTGLAWRRGPGALAAINKSGSPWTVTARLDGRVFRDLVSGHLTEGPRVHWVLPPRSSLLLVRHT